MLTNIGLVMLAVLLAMAGGALSGMKLAGEHLGNELAAMTGAFFGPMPVLPAAVVGIIVFEVLL